MSSPVERLEAWCDKNTFPAQSQKGKRRAEAYRAIIDRYRVTEREQDAAVKTADSFQDIHTADIRLWELYVVINVLADAVNPDKENPK